MIERPDADALLAGPLGQWLSAQNADRDAAKAKARTIRFWGMVAAGAVALLITLMGRFDAGLKFGFFVGAAGFGIAEWSKRGVINRLKGGINGAIAEALGLQYSLEMSPGMAFQWAEAFKLLPGYDDSHFEDMWSGEVAGRPFTLHEAKLTEERGSGKSRRTVTVFEGSLMQVGFARQFLGTTLVERQGQRTRFGLFGEKEELDLGGVRLVRSDMADPRFEDAFTVWSNDQVEARYLVHPEYMERLVAVEQAFAGDNLRALFREGQLLIVLESGNMFESGSLDAEDDRRLLERTIAQFAALADLAAQLNERERPGFS
jgi:hypothetical protein